jgi:hypothetical protein
MPMQFYILWFFFQLLHLFMKLIIKYFKLLYLHKATEQEVPLILVKLIACTLLIKNIKLYYDIFIYDFLKWRKQSLNSFLRHLIGISFRKEPFPLTRHNYIGILLYDLKLLQELWCYL